MPKSFIKQLTLTVILGGMLSTALVALPSSALADTPAGTDAQTQTAVQAGVQYLANNQATDGSITGTGGESEWSTVALEADGQNASDLTNSTSGTSLTDFIQTDVPAPTTPATTIERSIIAIAATGGDTSNYGGVDYNAALAAQDNANQIGDPTLLNDDTFGIIAADASHNDALVPVAQDGLDYLLAHQAADGGFSYTTTACAFCGSDGNDTAAAIIAMYAGQDMGLTQSNPAAQTNALNYLLSTQQPDGGFGYDALSPPDGDSTAWALMALNTIGESVATQAQLARDWLLADQQPDGGFSYGAFGVTASDTYTTAHALIALLGTNWLLNPAPVQQSSQTGGQGGGSVNQTDQSVQPGGQTAPPATLAAVYTTSGSTSGQTAAQTASTVPQPQAATNTKTNKQAPKTIATTTNKSNTKYTVYAVAVLILVALGWFMLESQKDRGVK